VAEISSWDHFVFTVISKSAYRWGATSWNDKNKVMEKFLMWNVLELLDKDSWSQARRSDIRDSAVGA